MVMAFVTTRIVCVESSRVLEKYMGQGYLMTAQDWMRSIVARPRAPRQKTGAVTDFGWSLLTMKWCHFDSFLFLNVFGGGGVHGGAIRRFQTGRRSKIASNHGPFLAPDHNLVSDRAASQ